MTNIINLQETAASLYNTIVNLNKSATALIGLDAVWCRLLPYDNGEDVIVQEYTLHQYECPKNIKIVSNNANYNVGNFTIDLFGIKNAETLEISIDIDTWKSVYGNESIPQKGDFVLIPLMHRPYEVISSTAIHTIGEKITAWKCILGEWKHAASRKETKDFNISIDELTNSQDRLFGDAISKEVADAVNDVETAYNTTTYVDPIKDFDMKSIIVEDVYGKNRNIITNAYYSFIDSEIPVKYKVSAKYDETNKENKWIYSCWFKANSDSDSTSIKINLQTKDNNYWYFTLSGKTKLKYAQKALICRGTQIVLAGEVDKDECSPGWLIKIPASECLLTNKKFPKFWESGIWKLKTMIEYNLFTAYYNEKIVLKIDITSDKIINFKCNDISKCVSIVNMKLDVWNYIAFELSPSILKIVIAGIDDNVIIENIPINIKTIEFNSAQLNNEHKNICLTNIRLFENEYELSDAYKQDMYSQVVRNASKLILVDTPKAPNNMSFKSQIR